VSSAQFRLLTVGWEASLVQDLWRPIAAKTDICFSHVVHPRHTLAEWPGPPMSGIHFFRDKMTDPLAPPDRDFLRWLENDDVPTINNMILGDRVVCTLPYEDALAYATFLGKRLRDLFERIAPAAVLGSFDALHGSIGLAVAKRMNIPWFALNFSVMPPGLAGFCDQMSPSARVILRDKPIDQCRALAESALSNFESGKVQSPAYIEPPRLSLLGAIRALPKRLTSAVRTIQRGRARKFHQFTEGRGYYSVPAALRRLRAAESARDAVQSMEMLNDPPATPFVFFGLHTQPESSIDVWAPFFSNQMWVVELLSRSIPPTHNLLVKIHKSDTASYSRAQLLKMRGLPGVQLVKPFADTRRFIESADLVVAIQGTIGLEAALLGVPVIMLGDSPAALFPSVSSVGEIEKLPELMRRQIAQARPTRPQIIDAYASFLMPFEPATHNDWTEKKCETEIERVASLIELLRTHVAAKVSGRCTSP
jgi:Capsule polysaccharide biosynthesis protein